MSTDREHLRAVVEAGESLLSGDGVGVVEHLRRAVDAGRAHLGRTVEHDCSAEVARASRAAYAAGQARASGGAP